MRGTSFGSLWVPLVAIVALLSALATLRPPLETLWGDEGTYVAMATSLVRDGDLAFAEADRAWAEERVPDVGATVILQRTSAGLTYSKPVIYALLGAPFVWLLGEEGLIALNAALLLVAVLLAWLLLRRRGETDLAALTLLSFVGCGALLPYLLWRVSDLAQFSLTLIGLILVCAGLSADHVSGRDSTRGPWPLWAAAIGAGALGLSASMRLPNAALVAAAALACLVARRPKRALVTAVAAAIAFSAAGGAGLLLTGTANPYKAVRASFHGEVGYPVGEGAETVLERFAEVPATQSVTWRPATDSARPLHSMLYFVLGRHTGLLLYFPMALLLAYRIARHPGRVGLSLAAGLGVIALFYLVWLPDNYFGGSTFVGNRYFLTSYAALLVAAPGLPSGRQLVPVWLIAAVVGISALVSVENGRGADLMSQSHAYNGVFRILPYESTAREIDGQRDRYWSGDFVRFVDPHAEVGPYSFTLDSEQAPAELLVASRPPLRPVHLLITSAQAPLELRVADWGRRRWLKLDRAEDGTRAEVALDLSRPWRHHKFWWTDLASYGVRSFRLMLLTPDGRPARAEVRYLSDGRLLRREPARDVLRLDPPEVAPAGGLSRIAVSVRNTGEWSWTSEGILPVYLSYRLRAPDGFTLDGPRTQIETAIEPGRLLRRRLKVAWPETPGDYGLSIDLVIENVAWFEDSIGEPLIRTVVRVR